MPIDPLGKAILGVLMEHAYAKPNTLRRIAQAKARATAQEFWQRMETLEQMKMIRSLTSVQEYTITDKGRAFYLADGIVDTEPTP